MDYKKVIKSKKMRASILNALNFIPDSIMLSIQYKIKMGFYPDLKHPRRYTEKIQWYKMHYRNPLIKMCVDKYDVREFVKSKGLEDILVKNYGVYDNVDKIDWNSLPSKFVLKQTNGSGGFEVILCKDKNLLNIPELRNKLKEWLRHPTGISEGREWAYNGLAARITIEQYLESKQNSGGVFRIINFYASTGMLNMSF